MRRELYWSEILAMIISPLVMFGLFGLIIGLVWSLAIGKSMWIGLLVGGIVGGGIPFILAAGMLLFAESASKNTIRGMVFMFSGLYGIALILGLVTWLVTWLI